MNIVRATRREFLATLGGLAISSQAGPSRGAGDDAASRLKTMKGMAASISLAEIADGPSGDRKPISLRPEPLLRYSDEARTIRDAALWTWGSPGRPSALLKVELLPAQIPERRWVEGLVSLSPRRISVDFGSGRSWTARTPGLSLVAIPDAPTPAGSEGARLGQMKTLARRFSASQYAGPARGRLQLRLMASPLLRYADSASALIDGALFALAYGTNPDVLLALEARRDGSSAPSWRYAFARLGGGEASASLDGKEVWTVPYADPPASRDTYMNRWLAEGAE